MVWNTGYEVVVELKSDKEVKGYVEEVTSTMDLVLRQCTVTSMDDRSTESMDQYLVAGKSIRFVHLPPNVQVAQVSSSFMKKMEQNERRNAPNKIHDAHNSSKRK